jgi:hypothetical protein
MSIRQKTIPVNEHARKALEEVGGEPLAGSGFEGETPGPEFSDTAIAAPDPQQ